MRIKKFQLIIFLGIIEILACSKESVVNNKTSASAISNIALSACDQFAYPDTIFYQQQLSVDYIIKPVTQLTGTFGAFPAGLRINPLTGHINVTKSETGLEYIVWFVAAGTTDTCKKFITISGVNYTDSVYVLANNRGVAQPVYNANLVTPVDCSGGCEFDDGPDDDNGNGTADEPPAGQELIPQGIAINKKTGVINLKKSISNGALGTNPVSGTHKDFVLNYRLGDKSSKALNHISFRLYYYKTQAEIPAELKETLNTKKGQVLLENEDGDDHGGGHNGGHSGPHVAALNLLAGSAAETAKNGKGETKCRPPYIIVTQR